MTPFVWSFTAIQAFTDYPDDFYRRFVLGEKPVMSPAMQKGIEVHKACEDFMKGQKALIDPTYYPLLKRIYDAAQGKKLLVECKMGVLGNLEACGFFDDHVWGRGAADVIIIDYPNAFIGDWKTGQGGKTFSQVLKYEKRTQLAILALFVFEHFPRVERITGCNLWLEHGKPGQVHTFDRSGREAGWIAVCETVRRIEKFVEQERSKNG